MSWGASVLLPQSLIKQVYTAVIVFCAYTSNIISDRLTSVELSFSAFIPQIQISTQQTLTEINVWLKYGNIAVFEHGKMMNAAKTHRLRVEAEPNLEILEYQAVCPSYISCGDLHEDFTRLKAKCNPWAKTTAASWWYHNNELFIVFSAANKMSSAKS